MRKKNKLLICTICLILLVCSNFIPANAANITGPTIEIPDITGVPLDTVRVYVNILENPGTMAMTFTVSYDKEALTFKEFYYGVLLDYTLVDHPERGYISFVNCESWDKKKTGTAFSIDFEVKENAKPGYHPFKIQNIRPEKYGDSMNGCFANWNGDKITPIIKNGGITIGETCHNMGHTYSEWEILSQPLCETEGTRSRACIKCGHSETDTIPAVGHQYSKNWTVDREASEGVSGVLSRHCLNCDAVTDKVYFSLPDTETENLPNKENAQVSANDYKPLKEIAEQNKNNDAAKNQSDISKQPAENKQIIQKENNDEIKNNLQNNNIVNAEELIEKIKSPKKDGIAGKVYHYLFGADGATGIAGQFKSMVFDFSFGNFKTAALIFLLIILM